MFPSINAAFFLKKPTPSDQVAFSHSTGRNVSGLILLTLTLLSVY